MGKGSVQIGCRTRSRACVVWRYFLAVLREFRWTLLALGAAVSVGAALYAITPHENLGGRPPSLDEAIYGAWMALLSQPILSPPPTWYLELLCAVYPLLGFALIGEGVVRFALLMLSKRHGEKEWMRVMASTYRDHVVLCGLGHLGFRVLEQLVASQVPVVGIEKNADGRFIPAAKALGVPVLTRDMKEDQSLLDAGIREARAIIVATDDDMANLEVALDARRMNPKIRILMRLFDQQIAAKISKALSVDVAFSSSALAAPIVAALSLETKVLSSILINGVPHVTCELTVADGSSLANRRIDEVEAAHAIRILARTPIGGPTHAPPSPAMTILAGDVLVIHAQAAQVSALSVGCASQPA